MALGLSVALAAWSPLPAPAADCRLVPSTVHEVQQAVWAGTQLKERLDASGAMVAIVGRIGTDQSRRGIRYTHAGLTWRDHPRGRWFFVHLLNQCGSDASQLYDDGPASFFLEHPFSYDSWVILPADELQQSIVALLHDGVDRALHEPAYSAIANPFDTRYQNSNQWLLEVVALALEPDGERTRAGAQRILRQRGYQPERVRLGFFERIGARRMDNVSLRDHSRGERREGGYQYVSVRSLVEFLEAQDAVQEAFEIPGPPTPR